MSFYTKTIFFAHKALLFFIAVCLFFFVPAHADAKKMSIKKINAMITEKQETINGLIASYNDLNTECTEAINNALENNLLVNQKDLTSLQKQSSNLKDKTTLLEESKVQQETIQDEIDEITDTSLDEYRKKKLEIITLQKRQIKLHEQINKIMKKIIKLCTVQ